MDEEISSVVWNPEPSWDGNWSPKTDYVMCRWCGVSFSARLDDRHTPVITIEHQASKAHRVSVGKSVFDDEPEVIMPGGQEMSDAYRTVPLEEALAEPAVARAAFAVHVAVHRCGEDGRGFAYCPVAWTLFGMLPAEERALGDDD